MTIIILTFYSLDLLYDCSAKLLIVATLKQGKIQYKQNSYSTCSLIYWTFQKVYKVHPKRIHTDMFLFNSKRQSSKRKQ